MCVEYTEFVDVDDKSGENSKGPFLPGFEKYFQEEKNKEEKLPNDEKRRNLEERIKAVGVENDLPIKEEKGEIFFRDEDSLLNKNGKSKYKYKLTLYSNIPLESMIDLLSRIGSEYNFTNKTLREGRTNYIIEDDGQKTIGYYNEFDGKTEFQGRKYNISQLIFFSKNEKDCIKRELEENLNYNPNDNEKFLEELDSRKGYWNNPSNDGIGKWLREH